MIELKCKMCGGDLKIIDNNGYAICEYCGSKMLLPNINNTINDKLSNFDYLLINAKKALDDENWTDVEKYYSLLQNKFPKDIIIEATFFTNIAKVMINPSVDNWQKLYSSLDTIVNFYDYTNENKEYIFNKISEYLFKKAFPKGEITPVSCNSFFYNALPIFTTNIGQLTKTHNDAYINILVFKNIKILTTYTMKSRQIKKRYKVEYENHKNNTNNILKFVKLFLCICLFILIINCISEPNIFNNSILEFLLIIFIFGLLPYLVIKGIIKLLELIRKNK